MKSCCLILVAAMFAGLGALRPELVADDAAPTLTSQSVLNSAVEEELPSSSVNVDDKSNDDGISLDVSFSGPAVSRDADGEPSGRAQDEAYVDLKRLFDNEPGFCAGRDLLKSSIAESELKIKKLVDEARETAIELGSAHKGSPEERQLLQRAFIEKNAAIEAEQQVTKQSMLQREADLYHETFQRIKAAIAEYARANGIRIVRRKQAAVVAGLDDASRDPKDAIRLINQDILFNADEPRDITEPVLELLMKKAEQAK